MLSGKEGKERLYLNSGYLKLKNSQSTIHKLHYGKTFSGFMEKLFKRQLMKLVSEQSSEVVDIGCGAGSGFDTFATGQQIIGVDRDLTLLKQCKKKYPQATLICCDMTRSPFKPGCFRAIFAYAVLEHVYWLESILSNLHKLLGSRGHLYVLVPTEGAISWTLGRNIFTLRRNARILGISHQEMAEVMRIEHCNTVYAVDSALRKFFKIDQSQLWPMRFGGTHMNLVKCYRLSSL